MQKNERKDEAVAFEQELWKLWQELKDGEKTWSAAEKFFRKKQLK